MKYGTRTGLVVDTILQRMETGGLARGERLPSIRRLARQLGLSPSTVSGAYDRLVAEGRVIARPGAGYFSNLSPTPEAATGIRRDHTVDPFFVSRQALESDPGIMQPGCGWLPDSWMPQALLRQGLRELARSSDAVLTGYGPARGSLKVRALLARRWAETQLYASPEQIMLTGSGSQSLDLVCRMLLRPGDCVLVDDPCYFNFRALLSVHRVRVVGIPFQPDGPDLDAFAVALSRESPSLYITNSGIQNPTGGATSLRKAHALLSLMRQYDLHIVEDDIFADFAPWPAASLAPLDGLDRVIRIGSFSKTLTASLRCGYVAARPDLIEALGDLQIATGFTGASPVAARIVQHVLESGSYKRHLEGLNRRLSRARRDCAARLASLTIRPWVMPQGGFSLWCTMPEGCDVSLLAQLALEEELVLAPGAVFSDTAGAARCMRFNVAQMAGPEVYRRLEKLLERAAKAGHETPPDTAPAS